MAASIWRIRDPKEDEIDLDFVYGNDPTRLTLKIFHGGHFSKYPSRTYENGKVNFIDYVDIDDLGINVLKGMVQNIGYPSDMVLYYHFKDPYVCLDFDLHSLSNDCDFANLFDHVRKGFKLIEIYIEHWHSHVLMNSILEDVGPTT